MCGETSTPPLVEVLQQQNLKPSPLPLLAPLARLFPSFSHTRAPLERLCPSLLSDDPLGGCLLIL